jgi:hypothetical protein
MIREGSESHPSYLALDRASLGLASDTVWQHLESCGECRDYVRSLEESGTEAGLRDVERRIRGSRWTSKRVWLGAVSFVAVAATVLVFVAVRPQPELPEAKPYIGEKGFTSVWIYVRRGTATALWDGRSPVFPGDRLRLKVDPGRFKWVEVYSTKNPTSPELLYEGTMSAGRSTTLPEAWEVDAEPGDERLLVVLSSEKVRPAWPDWLEGRAQSGVMLLPFSLPKVMAPGSKTAPP